MIRQPGRLTILALVGCAAVMLATAASADWIVLDNGRKLEGTVQEKDDDKVRIKLPGGSVTIARGRIRSITDGEAPPAGEKDERERIAHSGGASRRTAEFRYLDGADPVTGQVVQPEFSVMLPVGELAHGTLVELLDFRTLNGVEMARVRVGEVDGWVPADALRKAPRAPVVPR